MLPAGHYSTTLRVVTGDVNQNVLNTADFTVSLDVVAPPTIAPNAVTFNWEESTQPAAQTLTVTHDPAVQLQSAVVSGVTWLDVATSGDIIQLRAVADDAAVHSARKLTIAAANTRTTPVRMNVAKLELTPATPTLPRMAVKPANGADASAKASQGCCFMRSGRTAMVAGTLAAGANASIQHGAESMRRRLRMRTSSGDEVATEVFERALRMVTWMASHCVPCGDSAR